MSGIQRFLPSRAISDGSSRSVLQTKYVSSGTRTTVNSTSFVEASTDYRLTITPSNTTNVIMLNYFIPMNPGANYQSNTIYSIRAFRIISGSTSYSLTSAGSTNGSRNPIAGQVIRPVGYDLNDPMFANFIVIDAPNTTSQCTYGFEVKREGGGTGTLYFGYSMADNDIFGYDTDIVIFAQEFIAS